MEPDSSIMETICGGGGGVPGSGSDKGSQGADGQADGFTQALEHQDMNQELLATFSIFK